MIRCGIWQEKANAFSSVGSSSSSAGKDGAGGASALNAAVFKRFNGSSSPAARAECFVVSGGGGVAESGDDPEDDDGSGVRLDVEDIAAGSRRGRESRKRKSPLGACAPTFLTSWLVLRTSRDTALISSPQEARRSTTTRAAAAGTC